MHPVEIFLSTDITSEGQTERLRQRLTGTVFEKDHTFFVKYKEQLEDQVEVRNVIKVTNDSVTINRYGGIQMNQTFREGEAATGVYRSPHGAFQMKTKTRKVKSKWDALQKQGFIHFIYDLTFNDTHVGLYDLYITLKGEQL